MIKKIPNADALLIVEESIREGIPVRLRVRGNSMSPLLRDGIDVVTLHPFIPANLQPGEIILFHYKDRFLLHRIIQIDPSGDRHQEPGIIITRGDALSTTETITFADVIAVAEVPKHSSLKRIYRHLVFLFYKVRGHLSSITM